MDVGADGVFQFQCVYTGEKFGENDVACPCWPRLPMGWNWFVFWAVELAEGFLQRALEKNQMGTIASNIAKKTYTSLKGMFQGCYIDNLFTVGASPSQVNYYQKLMTKEFEDNGLIMSEDDPAKIKRKLLGAILDGEEGEIRPPEQILQEVEYVRNRGRVRV